MDYEKKYKEALERAKKIENGEPIDVPDGTHIPLAIFPELYELEDERVRKELIDAVQGLWENDKLPMPLFSSRVDAWMAWLIKQGESDEARAKMFLINKGYPIDTNGVFPTYKEMYNIIREGLEQQSEQKTSWSEEDENSFLNALWCCKKAASIAKDENEMVTIWCTKRWLKSLKERAQPKQGEQKSVDKVEPKFKADDWVVTDKGDTVQIGAVNNGYYTLCNGMDFNMSYVDKCWHLWTVNDAKEGDVLYSHEHNLLWIYKDKDTYHVATNLNYPHDISIGGDIVIPSDVCLAPKEQCDILLARIKKYGYTWDKNTKKLIY